MDWLNFDFEKFINDILLPYAYQPLMVYSITVVMMVLSAFGLPLPEEVTIITIAILAYMGAHPNLYPPPFPDAPVVDMWVASLICVSAVLFSDIVVYSIGHRSGKILENSPRFKKIFQNGKMIKIQKLTHEYGIWAVFMFRFMPGVRFPGHLFCGMMNYKLWKFLAIDAFAALISIPTQILLVGTYGEAMVSTFKKFKIILFSILGVLVLSIVIKRIWLWYKAKTLRLQQDQK